MRKTAYCNSITAVITLQQVTIRSVPGRQNVPPARVESNSRVIACRHHRHRSGDPCRASSESHLITGSREGRAGPGRTARSDRAQEKNPGRFSSAERRDKGSLSLNGKLATLATAMPGYMVCRNCGGQDKPCNISPSEPRGPATLCRIELGQGRRASGCNRLQHVATRRVAPLLPFPALRALPPLPQVPHVFCTWENGGFVSGELPEILIDHSS